MRTQTFGDAKALHRQEQRQPFDLPFAALSAVFDVYFPDTTVRDVAHGLGETPDGVLIYLQVGGYVLTPAPHTWTKDVAYLQASAAETRARVQFFVLRENIINA